MLIFSTTACTSGPKLSEDGPRFQQAAQTVLDDAIRFRVVEGDKPTVKQDATTDVSCGDDTAKRVFEASVPLNVAISVDNAFDLTMSSVMGSAKGYSIETWPDSDDPDRRELTMRAGDYPATIKAVVTAKPVPTLTLTGETDCLTAG